MNRTNEEIAKRQKALDMIENHHVGKLLKQMSAEEAGGGSMVDSQILAEAAARLEGAGWQSIETAPRDGRYVLLWQQYNDSPVVGQYLTDYWRCNGENLEVSCGLWCQGGSIRTDSDFKPTHWMPLPQPPTPAAPCREE